MNDKNIIRNDSFIEALLKFNAEKTVESQEALIQELGLGRFLVPVQIKGNIKDGVLEKNSEISIKILADNNNNCFYPIFTDWDSLIKFTGENEDAIALTYRELSNIFKMNKEKITGIVFNPGKFEKDFILTEKIIEDINKRLSNSIKYKAVIFDLDGTIADSVESIAYSANRAIEEFGFKPFEVERFKTFAGDGADTLLKRCLIAAGDTELEYYDRVYDKYKELFAKDYLYNVKPYDGINELIASLKENNIKIAVLSNKPQDRAKDVIRDLFGENTFDIVLGHSNDRAKKPAPDGAIYIAEQLGVRPIECIYVGDTNTDMQTGKSAGMLTIGVTWGFRERPELEQNGADKIIDSPAEILSLLN